jgi:hypothetical protein
MKLSELKRELAGHKDWNVRFVLPGGETVAAHAHVTEVARIDKKYVDCGGTFRTDSFCRLQTWVADDLQHRLSAGKLLGILNKAGSFLETEEIDVDVEHEVGVITQFPLESAKPSIDALLLQLGERHTACLAKEKCLSPPTQAQPVAFKTLPKIVSGRIV